MSLLIGLEEAEFTFLKEKTESTAGNLSVQLDKLVLSQLPSTIETAAA